MARLEAVDLPIGGTSNYEIKAAKLSVKACSRYSVTAAFTRIALAAPKGHFPYGDANIAAE
jgi:hypothetical protein